MLQLRESIDTMIKDQEELLIDETPESEKIPFTKVYCECPTLFGEKVVIVGNHPFLGMWNPENGVQMNTSKTLIDYTIYNFRHWNFSNMDCKNSFYWSV